MPTPVTPTAERRGPTSSDQHLQELIKQLVEDELREGQRELVERVKSLESQVDELQRSCKPNKAQAAQWTFSHASNHEKAQDGYNHLLGSLEDASEDTKDLQCSADYAHVETQIATQSVHQLAETVWEASLLIAMPVVGSAGSVALTLCLLINIFVQSFFCFIVGGRFTEAPYPSAASFERWRQTTGHDWRYTDMVTKSSLVSRLCMNDDSLAVSNNQLRFLNEIRFYTQGLPFCGFRVGSTLCVFAILVWCLQIARELRSTISFTTAMIHIPSGHSWRVSEVVFSGNAFVFDHISWRRRSFACIVVLIRTSVALWLAFSGSLWLANTRNIIDLLQNAAALGFVLDVDEAIYATLVPHPTKVIMQALEQLPKMALPYWKGIGYASALSILGCAGFVSVFSVTFVWPSVDGMQAIETALCAGNKDFVFGIQPATNLVYVTETTPFSAKTMEASGSYRRQAVSKIITGTALMDITGASYSEDIEVFESRMAQGMEEYSKMWSKCEDFPPPWDGVISQAMRSLTGVQDAASCPDLKQYCTGIDNRFLRLICPVTCGCRSPTSGLMMSSSFDGCMRQTCRSSKEYREALKQIPCQDASAAQLADSAEWNSYCDQYEHYWATAFPDFRELTATMAQKFREEGCKGVETDYADDLCNEVSAFSSIRPFCPVTCGCGASDLRNCPLSCATPVANASDPQGNQ